MGVNLTQLETFINEYAIKIGTTKRTWNLYASAKLLLEKEPESFTDDMYIELTGFFRNVGWSGTYKRVRIEKSFREHLKSLDSIMIKTYASILFAANWNPIISVYSVQNVRMGLVNEDGDDAFLLYICNRYQLFKGNMIDRLESAEKRGYKIHYPGKPINVTKDKNEYVMVSCYNKFRGDPDKKHFGKLLNLLGLDSDIEVIILNESVTKKLVEVIEEFTE